MESMRQYAQRRAFEVKKYHWVAEESGIGEDAYEWLCKFARGELPNPGINRVEKLYHFYKLLEVKQRRKAA